jgi:hypothetical protein
MQRSDDYPLAVYAPIPTDHTPRTDADLKATLPGEQVCVQRFELFDVLLVTLIHYDCATSRLTLAIIQW